MHHLIASILLFISVGVASAVSPYAGQETQPIKSLSADEVSDFLSGKGMGLAKAAELNGYPGPFHVLELSAELELTTEQRVRTEALFQAMETKAIALGRALVEEERVLDRLFSSRTVTSENLASTIEKTSGLRGQIRRVHLDAHLQQTAILTARQIEKYRRLRGYGSDHEHEHAGGKHH